MTWHWRYERADGTAVEGPRAPAANQSDAESWLGEHWKSLLDSGIDQVTLVEDERVVYGPMSLHPPE
jgi:hypothetical protein